VASLAFAGWAFRKLPGEVVTHWGVDGSPDGWSSPLTAVLLFPAIGLLLLLVFWVLPRIDPRREAYTASSSPYWILANITLLVVALLHIVVLGNGLGWAIRIPVLVPVMVWLFVVSVPHAQDAAELVHGDPDAVDTLERRGLVHTHRMENSGSVRAVAALMALGDAGCS
jgi:uncharacterized membrane protein